MSKKIMSTMLHRTFFFTAKFKFVSRIFQIFSWFCKGVLSCQTRTMGVTIPHITPVLYRNWVCSEEAISEKQCKGAWPSMILSVRSDDLTHNPSPSSYLTVVRLSVRSLGVRLQSRVTSSDATVKSWMCVCFLFFLLLLIVFLFYFIKFLFIYLCIYFFLSLHCLFVLLVFVLWLLIFFFF